MSIVISREKSGVLKMELQIEYGIENKYHNVTELAQSKCVSGNHLYIPSGDMNRAHLFGDPFPGILKHIRINGTEIYPHNVDIQRPVKSNPQISYRQPISPDDAKRKLAKIHQHHKLTGGSFLAEYPEQLLSVMFIQPNDKVLELGSNIGRNTLVIASLLQNSQHLVTLECDSNICQILRQNRDINGYSFQIENAALSARRLIQQDWITIPSDHLLPGFHEIQTISWPKLIHKYPLQFNVLVADCEGAMYYILNDTPEMLNSLKLLILENDYGNIEHKKFVDSVIMAKGFHRIYAQMGGWGPCEPYFYEVFQKV
jgi:FkbM family methyltransferase